jgi:hypothetical protein
MSKRNALSPIVWGPKGWFFLESIALGYPEEPSDDEKESMKDLILSLENLLPCGTCRYHYGEYLKNYLKNKTLDTVVDDRYSLITFIIELHNDVRIRNGQTPRTVGEVFTYYQKMYLHNDVDTLDKDGKSPDMVMDYAKNILFHFNPITLLVGVLIGLIIFKLFNQYFRRL